MNSRDVSDFDQSSAWFAENIAAYLARFRDELTSKDFTREEAIDILKSYIPCMFPARPKGD